MSNDLYIMFDTVQINIYDNAYIFSIFSIYRFSSIAITLHAPLRITINLCRLKTLVMLVV